MPRILEGEDFKNPELTGPRRSKEIPGGGVYSAYAEVTVQAPPQAVYDAILNVGDWKHWNKVVYDVTITKTLNPHARGEGSHKRITGGSCMIFHARLPPRPDEKIREVVTMVEKLKTVAGGHSQPCITRIRWRLDNAAATTPSMFLKTERVNEIEDMGNGTTVYRTWQVFSGPIARYMRKRMEIPMRDALQVWAQDLKTWVEKKPESNTPDRMESVGGVVERPQQTTIPAAQAV